MNNPIPHEAMLLAAGLGRRMRPLTETLPKPLVEVGGVALIDRVIANARAEGVTRFVVNAHHHADLLRAHLAASRSDLAISDETALLLDTGGGVRNALPLLSTDPILVMNTDAFWPLGADRPLARLAHTFADSNADIALLCARPARATGFDRSHDFCLDPRRRITADFGAPVIYAGVALIARRMFEDTPDGPFSLTWLFDRARTAGTLFGAPLDSDWLHVGDVAAIGDAEKVLRNMAGGGPRGSTGSP